MDGLFLAVDVSRNKKTGPIPVITAPRDTCPPSCALYNKGCYALYGRIKIHWDAISKGERGLTWDQVMDYISRLPKYASYRYGQAGDVPGDGTYIDEDKIEQWIRINKRRRPLIYCHYPLNGHNIRIIKYASKHNLTINASANNPKQAAQYFKKGLPTVTLIPEGSPNRQIVDGVPIVRCPAEYDKKTTCATCMVCNSATRNSVIGFTPHGSGKKYANRIALQSI